MVYKSKVKVAKFILSIKINVQTNVNDTSFILTNTYITTLEKHFVSGSVRLFLFQFFATVGNAKTKKSQPKGGWAAVRKGSWGELLRS